MYLKEVFNSASIQENEADIYFYGDIIADEGYSWGEDEVYPSFVAKFLKDVEDKTLNVHINSAGGNVFAGFAIYNMLKQRKAKTVVYVEGWAASIASVIAMAGAEIHIYNNCYLMIHKAWTMACGNSTELAKTVATLEQLDTAILDIYKGRMNNASEENVEYLKNLIANESFLNAEEVAELFSNVILEDALDAVACAKGEYTAKMKLPKNITLVDIENKSDSEKKKQLECKIKILKLQEEMKL